MGAGVGDAAGGVGVYVRAQEAAGQESKAGREVAWGVQDGLYRRFVWQSKVRLGMWKTGGQVGGEVDRAGGVAATNKNGDSE